MDGLTINTLLRHVPNYIGVYARDTLPIYMGSNCGLIVNTDLSTQNGTHWVAMFRDNNGFCEYFDPYGIPPLLDEFTEFLSNNSTIGIRVSQQQLQCVQCVTCGYYCVEYIKFRCNGFTLNNLLHSFTLDPYVNEILIRNRINNPVL